MQKLIVNSQAEIYAAIWVACMPSLAKVWKIKFTETKFYAGLQSLLHSMRGSQSTFNKSSRNSRDSSETLTEPQKDPHAEYKLAPLSFSSVRRASEEGTRSQEESGIYRMVTVDLSSQRMPEP